MHAQRLPTKQVVRRCPFCGARISQQDHICPMCGEQMLSAHHHQPTAPNATASAPMGAKRGLVRMQPKPRTLSHFSQSAATPANLASNDPTVWGRPREMVYVRCPSCGAQNGLTDLQCGVCGQAFGSVMPISQGPRSPQPHSHARPQLDRHLHPQRNAAHAQLAGTATVPLLQTAFELEPEPMPALVSFNEVDVIDEIAAPTRPQPMPTPVPTPVIDVDVEGLKQDQSMRTIHARTNRIGSILAVSMAMIIFSVGIFLFQLGNSKPQPANALPQPPASTQVKINQSQAQQGARGNARPVAPTAVQPTPKAAQSTGGQTRQSAKAPVLVVEHSTSPQRLDDRLMIEPTPMVLEFYASPALMFPQDGAVLSKTEGTLKLRWNSSKALSSEEFFVVFVQPVGSNNTFAFKTQQNQLVVDPAILNTLETQQLTWWVIIQRRMGIDPKTRAPIYQDLSPLGEVRRLQWLGK